MNIQSVAKAVTALLTALGTWGGTALADGQVSQAELFGLTGVIVAALAVWAVPNQTSVDGDRGAIDALQAVVLVVLVLVAILLWRMVAGG